MPTSPLPPVRRTQAGVAPRSSAHWRISSWPMSACAACPAEVRGEVRVVRFEVAAALFFEDARAVVRDFVCGVAFFLDGIFSPTFECRNEGNFGVAFERICA